METCDYDLWCEKATQVTGIDAARSSKRTTYSSLLSEERNYSRPGATAFMQPTRDRSTLSARLRGGLPHFGDVNPAADGGWWSSHETVVKGHGKAQDKPKRMATETSRTFDWAVRSLPPGRRRNRAWRRPDFASSRRLSDNITVDCVPGGDSSGLPPAANPAKRQRKQSAAFKWRRRACKLLT